MDDFMFVCINMHLSLSLCTVGHMRGKYTHAHTLTHTNAHAYTYTYTSPFFSLQQDA